MKKNIKEASVDYLKNQGQFSPKNSQPEPQYAGHVDDDFADHPTITTGQLTDDEIIKSLDPASKKKIEKLKAQIKNMEAQIEQIISASSKKKKLEEKKAELGKIKEEINQIKSEGDDVKEISEKKTEMNKKIVESGWESYKKNWLKG